MLDQDLDRISPDLVIHKSYPGLGPMVTGKNTDSKKMYSLSKKGLMQSKGNDQFSSYTGKMKEVYKEEVAKRSLSCEAFI